jgi:NAD(P)-dependent dehydrogenase (short-subunit alcohol dehydrogenase family)
VKSGIDFAGRVAIVTGAGGGLGRGYALELARRGARVVVNDLGGAPDGSGSGSQSAAERVVAEIAASGGTALPSFDSVASEAGGRAIVETALKAWGRVDAVISNAGILRDRSFAKLGPADLEPLLDVHLRGAFFVLGPAFRAMKDGGQGGRIVLTTSASGLFGNFGQANYAAAKMGLVGLTRVLAIEGAKNGIHANAVAPIADTRLTGRSAEPGSVRSAERAVPLPVFLCHPSCPSNGEVFMSGWGWFSRVAVYLGTGWKPESGEASVDDIAANWDRVRDMSHAQEIVEAKQIIAMQGQKL